MTRLRPPLFPVPEALGRGIDALADEINASGAGICFVGRGCPRQKVLAYEMPDRVHIPPVAVRAAIG
jgi:UDP-N-acetyl-D-mannosaminuronic acid transferase (WecB/TagA/CpsF family)